MYKNSNNNTKIPLSLYIHIPWCIRKCPYCNFNSHTATKTPPIREYITTLIRELHDKQYHISERQITSIFIGGGTPSLIEAKYYEMLFTTLKNQFNLHPNLEITLEANPGTVEQTRFIEYHAVGINRLSIGVQSFNDTHLKTLGRIHNANDASHAVSNAHKAGFDKINIDLMFGLPKQTISEAAKDLTTAMHLEPSHISWYQLTLEPNTYFYSYPPTLPKDDTIWEMQEHGKTLLIENRFLQYEVSAFCKNNAKCKHNLNYWQYGDYLGIGAGAHSKITQTSKRKITRHWNVKNPRDYMNHDKNTIANEKSVGLKDQLFEFMLNALRLQEPIPLDLLYQRTYLPSHGVDPVIQDAIDKELLHMKNSTFEPTELGRRFLNDLVSTFLPK